MSDQVLADVFVACALLGVVVLLVFCFLLSGPVRTARRRAWLIMAFVVSGLLLAGAGLALDEMNSRSFACGNPVSTSCAIR